MSHSYLDSTPSNFLLHTHVYSPPDQCIGKGLINRIGKLTNNQREGKLTALFRSILERNFSQLWLGKGIVVGLFATSPGRVAVHKLFFCTVAVTTLNASGLFIVVVIMREWKCARAAAAGSEQGAICHWTDIRHRCRSHLLSDCAPVHLSLSVIIITSLLKLSLRCINGLHRHYGFPC